LISSLGIGCLFKWYFGTQIVFVLLVLQWQLVLSVLGLICRLLSSIKLFVFRIILRWLIDTILNLNGSFLFITGRLIDQWLLGFLIRKGL
jgi:hypothetical protein